MREYSVPATAEVADSANLTDMVFDLAGREPDRVTFARLGADGGWADVTADRFAAEVRALAKGFLAAGVETGERVAIMSKTRYEWTLVDYALWTAGAVPVPIYETSSAEQVEWILTDAAVTAVVVGDSDHAAVVGSVRTADVRAVWVLDDGAVDTLVAGGADVPDRAVEERRRAVRADDLATVIYTSGTTGRPKGCELTHRNLLFEVMTVTTALDTVVRAENAGTLLFLPLAHVVGRVLQCSFVYAGARLAHTADIKNLLPQVVAFRPTVLIGIPRVFEKVYNGAGQRAHAEGKGKIFDAAVQVAIAHSEARDTGRRIPLTLGVQHRLFDKLVYAKLRAALGGRCTSAICGSAPLGDRLGHFFRGIGLSVFEGYGLTETTAAATINTAAATRIGTVGRPLPGVGVRVAEDGEVSISGPVVFGRYRNNPDATAESLREGWFATGDLGELDEDGYLRITGRKKEIIVTSGGKNVSPAVLEDRLRAHPLVSQCMVVGDRRPFVAALVTLDEEGLPAWNKDHGRAADTGPAELRTDPELLADIQAAVDEANKAVSRAESIRAFRVLPADFTEAAGEITPSLKVKRAVVLDRYAEEIAEIYADSGRSS